MPLNRSNPAKISKIEELANTLRQEVIEMLCQAGSGHTAGALGTAEIFATLYTAVLNIDPKDPLNPNRDVFMLSNGHICPIWYATLAHTGFFEKTQLRTLRKMGSNLQGHPLLGSLPGIENSSGSLGQGFSTAVGYALASKIDNKTSRVYCLTGDGELQEGQIWEGAMFAPNKRLHNFTWIIDRNNIQIDGYTEDIMPLESLRNKLEAFNWHVVEIDGHNVEEIIGACNLAKSILERPTVIIAHTIPGKGVDFMEYKFEWHGKPPDREEAKKALKELQTLAGKIQSEYD